MTILHNYSCMHLIFLVVYDYKCALLLTVAAIVSSPVHGDCQMSNVSDVYKSICVLCGQQEVEV